MIKKVNEIEEYILSNYYASDCALTEYHSCGNSSDVFNDGYRRGYVMALHKVSKLFGVELEEPHEQEYDWM